MKWEYRIIKIATTGFVGGKIDEIALVRSELEPTGAVYTTAARFATVDATPPDLEATD